MKIFFLSPRPDETGNRFLDEVASLAGRENLEVFQDLSIFALRIRRSKDQESVALVFDPSHSELRELGTLRDFLPGTRMLLVLRDQEAETIALAHRLFPTYIAYVDYGLSELLAILGRLLKGRAAEPPVVKFRTRNSQT